MKRLEAKIYGHVQGVFFRDTTTRRARQLNVIGWVRNERDGTVRVVAEGKEEAVQTLLTFLHQGPRAARVERVDTEWGTATGAFNDFDVRM